MRPPEPYVPAGFDDFWQETCALAESAPFDYQVGFDPVTPSPNHDGQTDPGTISAAHEVRPLTFRGIQGEMLSGWVASPESPDDPAGSSSGFLWIAPYGRESLMPNQYGTREGFVSLSFNFFGHDGFHQEKYTPTRGYFADGVLDRRTWVFRTMFQNAVIALRVLSDLPSVDPERIGTMGMSQGGGMSIWLGAWSDRVKAVCADMPFLGAMHETLMKNVYRYPLKELMDFSAGAPDRQEKVMETIAFFDTLNQATRCDKPTLVSVGLKDPAVKPVQVQAIFDALPGAKKLITYDWGHDWHPDMLENNRRWLTDQLAHRSN